MCPHTTMRVYGAQIKRYCVLCSKTYSSSSSLVITSRWFVTSHLGMPASVRLVYYTNLQKTVQRTGTLAMPRSKSISAFMKFQSTTRSQKMNTETLCHRPHSRQVTGARCTGGRGSPVMSWILLKANNAQCASGVGDKRFFSVLSEMCSICEQPLYDIMLMILHTNKWCVLISDQNLQMFFKSIWKIPSASGHSRSPFTSCRTRPSWHSGSSLGPHVLNGFGSMTLATTNTIYGKRDPALVDMWGTSYQNMKYQSSLRRHKITF